MLADVAPYLRCPVCGSDLELAGAALGCARGHRFDVARQGYASLLTGDTGTGTADTATMVAARTRLLGSGAFEPLTAAVASAAAAAGGSGPGCLVDAGGGTGHHLAHVLDRCPGRVGVCCDLSRHAARRAARAHPRLGAVVADVWRGLPVRDATASLVLNVFAPRNPAEFRRVLRPDGALVVVTPRPDHLGALVHALGLLSVDAEKPRRLREALGDRFTPETEQPVQWTMRLPHDGVRALVAMGPSAWHRTAADDRLSELPDPVEVRGSATVATYRPRRAVSPRPRRPSRTSW